LLSTPTPTDAEQEVGGSARLIEAMRILNRDDSPVFNARLEELAYLTNVLLSGAETEGRRFHPPEAAAAVLATVALGAELHAAGRRSGPATLAGLATPSELCEVMRENGADILFRSASAALAERRLPPHSNAFLRSDAELNAVLGAGA
jgi:hypothetical protein